MNRTQRSAEGPHEAASFDTLKALVALFVVAFLVRIAFSLFYGIAAPPLSRGDDGVYDRIARSIAFSGTYGNPWFPPGYSLFLAASYKTFGLHFGVIRVVQAAVGAATCVLVYVIGKRGFDARVGWLAAVLLALLPGHAYMSWRIMAETIYIFLLTAGVSLSLRVYSAPRVSTGAWLGVSLGLANAFKSNLIIYPPAVIGVSIPLLLSRRPPAWRAFAALVIAFAIASAFTPLGNMVASGGKVALLAGNAGHTLWFSNNPLADGYFADLRKDATGIAFVESHGRTEELAAADAIARDRIYGELALKWILENPRDFVVLCGRKLANAYGPFPRAVVFEGNSMAKAVHVATFASIIPLAIVGMLRARARWRELCTLYLVVVCHVAMVLIFYGTPRFTVIIMPVLLVFASIPLLEILTRLFAMSLRQGVARSPLPHA